MNARRGFLPVLLLAFAIGCERNDPLDFIPSDFVIHKPSDLDVDVKTQYEILKSADPVQDAKNAFRKGDRRLIAHGIGDVTPRPIYLGINRRSNFARNAEETWDYKRIKLTVKLVDDPDFDALRSNYESKYNSILILLADTAHKDEMISKWLSDGRQRNK